MSTGKRLARFLKEFPCESDNIGQSGRMSGDHSIDSVITDWG